MRGLLADADCIGHMERLEQLLLSPARRELWQSLDLVIVSFDELGLPCAASDRIVLERCRQEDLVLLTSNRNADGPDSLQNVLSEADCEFGPPVITLSNARRFLRDSAYAGRAADRLLDYLFEFDALRGTWRLFIP